MSSPNSLSAAKKLVTGLGKVGIESRALDVKNNEWLSKVRSDLGDFAVYCNSKGKVTISTHLISSAKDKDRALWALEQINAQATIKPVNSDTWVAYTDGSAQASQCGWAMVLFNPKGKKDREKYGNLGPQSNGQIAGEVEAAICVIKDAIECGIKRIALRHDYEGVGHWGNGTWKNKDLDASRLKKWSNYAKSLGHEVIFEWTRGHNGDAGNERADVLASKATTLGVMPRIVDPPITKEVKSALSCRTLELDLQF